jgi:amidohydrolase family protein
MNIRCIPGKIILTLVLASQLCWSVLAVTAQSTKVTAFTNGLWFNGSSFEAKTAYVVGSSLSFRRPRHIDETIDLRGGFVVPPFGEAHNHNVESLNKIDALVAKYLEHGIFYVKNPNSLARDRPVLAPKINRPQSIDVVFSNASFTGSGGHPVEIPERVIKRGLWTQADAEGGFYFIADNKDDLEKKWPALLATKPDFIKTYLLYSEEYAKRKNDPKYLYWRGLDPSLLPLIVKKAHAAGLRVSTHIESAADFHNALTAGVDEINHMSGFRSLSDVDRHVPAVFEISDGDAELASKRGIFVVTTLRNQQSDPNLQQQQDSLNTRNLHMLLKHHVKVALGSDSYRDDTLPEALYLHSLHVIDNATLLRMWCTTTAQTIFPHRKIGELKEGYEASFLVLESNPIENFDSVTLIRLRIKQGTVLKAN